MRGKKWFILPVGLVLVLLISSTGVTRSSFIDLETSTSNSFQAWVSMQWVQTTQGDFEAGVLNNVSTSSSPGDVALAAILSGSYIYAFQGDGNNAFLRYDISINSWALMANAPGLVEAGGALAYNGSNYIYAFQGNRSTGFWRYDIGANSWISMADAPGSVRRGGALAKGVGADFQSPGTIASQVLDTGVAGARWDALFWDETLQSNTDITFEVRASDTAFLKDAATPSWTSVGGTSPVTSGLPSGRYMQWLATLTTSDTLQTPTLHEVRVYHY